MVGPQRAAEEAQRATEVKNTKAISTILGFGISLWEFKVGPL
jgi:hypothetical protein